MQQTENAEGSECWLWLMDGNLKQGNKVSIIALQEQAIKGKKH